MASLQFNFEKEKPIPDTQPLLGHQGVYTLTQKDLNLLHNDIPIEKLSKTFQDALFTTLKLGFHFIWIDSLCIIQDLEDDWLKESSQMGRIYKHSSCNIAATGFSDGQHGLFVERDPEALGCPKVNVQWPGTWYNTKRDISSR